MASVIHYHVPAKKMGVKVPAPHHNSHIASLPEAVQKALGVKSIGSNEGFVCLCRPELPTDEVHGASGEPYAVTCVDCMKNEIWQADIVKNPHPSIAKELMEELVRAQMSHIEKGCC